MMMFQKQKQNLYFNRMEISKENKKKLIEIKRNKLEAVKEQNFEKAAFYRDQEVYLLKGLGLNVIGKSYSIRGNEIII